MERTTIDRALRAGTVVADARGRHCLPTTDGGLRLAHRLSGALCLTSAALHHGWEVREAPDVPHVLLPRRRKVPAHLRSTSHLHRRDLRIALEADSFLRHGHRSALRDDARRYAELVVAGWLVLRFAWEDVMHDPAWVRSVLERAVALRVGRTEGHLQPTAAARRRDGCTRCGSGPAVRSVRLTAP